MAGKSNPQSDAVTINLQPFIQPITTILASLIIGGSILISGGRVVTTTSTGSTTPPTTTTPPAAVQWRLHYNRRQKQQGTDLRTRRSKLSLLSYGFGFKS